MTSTRFAWRDAIFESDLTSTSKLVAICLARHMNKDGGSCYPTVTLLARESSLSRWSVLRAVDHLEKEGWIIVERRHRKANKYTATIPVRVAPPHPTKEILECDPAPVGLHPATQLSATVQHLGSTTTPQYGNQYDQVSTFGMLKHTGGVPPRGDQENLEKAKSEFSKRWRGQASQWEV